ncbi:MAG: FAD-binding protein [Treponema sp.]|nr:FAD-binding protein [Treponema sp.]
MIFDLSVIIKAQEEGDQNLIQKKLNDALRQKYSGSQKAEFVFVKKSVDARRGQLKLCLRYKAFVGEKAQDNKKEFSWKKADGKKKVVIIGSGPAGLFAALKLLESGVQPIIIERGKNTADRKRDIAAISSKGLVDADSNYCFGEGGAGTFSDGKLYTRSNKRGNIDEILQTFVFFGADPKILTDAHPHIGTNKLPQIVNKMRQKIIELGGEFHFESRAVDFVTKEIGGQKNVLGVLVQEADKSQKEFLADAVILASGHSANDVYESLAKISPESLEAKTFAVGVRVEHPRQLIDQIQYHGKRGQTNLGAAEYRLTSQIDERGVYSFCMCPGGFVVPSATGPEEIVVNGMSAAERNSLWSNAAIVVETRPEDIQKIAEEISDNEEILDSLKNVPTLAGLRFRKWLERKTWLMGGKSAGLSEQAAPAQLMKDFLEKKKSDSMPRSSYTPGIVSSRIDQWLPPFIGDRLAKAFRAFDKNMRGFVCPEALLIASETRTSTPVRILRDKDSFECLGLKRLFPCGEGSGWSGGIVSSAMDGQNCASALFSS